MVEVTSLNEFGEPDANLLYSAVAIDVKAYKIEGQSIVEIIGYSNTLSLDKTLVNRSFQDTSMTYVEVIKSVLGDRANVLFGRDAVEPINTPLFQYKETDWQFIRRLASHFNCCLYPASNQSKPSFYFGLKDTGIARIYKEKYTVGIDERYHIVKNELTNIVHRDFLYYTVETFDMLQIGCRINFDGADVYVHKREAEIKNGLLIFTYQLGGKKLYCTLKNYNEKLAGTCIIGEVIETSRETVKIHFNFDNETMEHYSFKWKPITGNLMYLMPQVGTLASLYFQCASDNSAIAIESPRTNNNDISELSNPAERQLVTEHGKNAQLFPSHLRIQSRTSGQQMALEDQKQLLLRSENKLLLNSSGDITISAPKVVVSSPQKVDIMKP